VRRPFSNLFANSNREESIWGLHRLLENALAFKLFGTLGQVRERLRDQDFRV
jgi:hypothetical protein